MDAVALGRPDDERAPAAADVEEPLPGLQLKLAADMVELLLLRDFERVVGAAEVRARVHVPRIEPQAEELVAYVVVMPDRASVECARMADPLAQPGGGAGCNVRRARQRFAELQDLAGFAVYVELLFDVVPRELAHRRMGERREDLRRMHRDVDARR